MLLALRFTTMIPLLTACGVTMFGSKGSITRSPPSESSKSVMERIEIPASLVEERVKKSIHLVVVLDNSPSMESFISALQGSLHKLVSELDRNKVELTITVLPANKFGALLTQLNPMSLPFFDWWQLQEIGHPLDSPATIYFQEALELPNGIAVLRHKSKPSFRSSMYSNISVTKSLEEAKAAISQITVDPTFDSENLFASAMDYFSYLKDTNSLKSPAQIHTLFLSSEDATVALGNRFIELVTPLFRNYVDSSSPRNIVGYYENSLEVSGHLVRNDICNGEPRSKFVFKKLCVLNLAETSGATYGSHTYSTLIANGVALDLQHCTNQTTGFHHFQATHDNIKRSCMTYWGKKQVMIDGYPQYVPCQLLTDIGCIPDLSTTPVRRLLSDSPVFNPFISDPASCQTENCVAFMNPSAQTNMVAGKLANITPISCASGYGLKDIYFNPAINNRGYCASEMISPVSYPPTIISEVPDNAVQQNFRFEVGVQLTDQQYATRITNVARSLYSDNPVAKVTSIKALESDSPPVGFVANSSGFLGAMKKLFPNSEVVSHAIVSQDGVPCSGVTGDFSKGSEYIKASESSQGVVSSICQKEFGPILKRIADNVVTNISYRYPITLNGKKVVKVILKKSGQELSTDRYQIVDNGSAIVFNGFDFASDETFVLVVI